MTGKTDPVIEHQVLGFLKIRWSYSRIVDHFKKQGIKICKATIGNIKNRSENSDRNVSRVSKRGRKCSLSKTQIQTLKEMVKKPNPPTQEAMAKRLKLKKHQIRYYINKKMNKKLALKPKVHAMSEATIEKRFRRSWLLYRKLRDQRWRKYITTDEAWFYIINENRKSRVQYKSRGQKKFELTLYQNQSHPKGVMVWMGISANGCTSVRFVKAGAKINSHYYINQILNHSFDSMLQNCTPTTTMSSNKTRHPVIPQKRPWTS